MSQSQFRAHPPQEPEPRQSWQDTGFGCLHLQEDIYSYTVHWKDYSFIYLRLFENYDAISESLPFSVG